MPGTLRKLVIVAAVDGVVLKPWAQRRAPSPSLHIDYASKAITPTSPSEAAEVTEGIEAYGIVGLLNVTTHSYLIAITGRKNVAQIWGKPVYLITDVAVIPLSSQKDASKAIKTAAGSAKREETKQPDQEAVADLVDDADNDSITSLEDTWLDHRAGSRSQSSTPKSTLQPTPGQHLTGGVARNVIDRKGAYGRFAERWFSSRGWTSGQQRSMGMSSHEKLPSLKSSPPSRRSSTAESRPLGGSSSPAVKDGATSTISPIAKPDDFDKPLTHPAKTRDVNNTAETILPKLLQTLKLLLISNMFYYSYDYDITRRCAKQPNSGCDLPLHKRCDPHFFWNAHLAEPLIQERLHDYVLPVMQGFVGQRAFELNTATSVSGFMKDQIVDASSEQPSDAAGIASKAKKNNNASCLLTLISRRSIKRAGFRYMRRGIDDRSNVANYVETEQVLSSASWETNEVQSFVQTRGSIPLFYSQTPYTFKPPPTLHGSKEANQRAFKNHFSNLALEYGDVQAVSLIDRQGPELPIGNAYEEQVELLNTSGGVNNRPLGFEWFDFHSICRGMKFENVALLINTLKPFLTSISWTTVDASTSKRTSTQSGIIRTNCMDCLDRTNVVQSAIAQHVLTQQLISYLSSSSPQPDPTSEAFNSLWADNGDALSLTYAGTAALKGDYVRTRRRNFAGVLTDLSLTLSRYYRNLFDDFFAQAALDFALGNVGESVFVEFREKMVTADVGVDLSKAREMAVVSAGKVVVSEDEDLLGGWVMSAPAVIGDVSTEGAMSLDPAKLSTAALRAQPFREVVLLLSDVAMYCVAYDWDAEKVRGFERVPLQHLRRLQSGAYITQTLTEGQRDSERNVGLLVEFSLHGEPHLRRVNTRTIGGVDVAGESVSAPDKEDMDGNSIWAFKALVGQSVPLQEPENNEHASPERIHVERICLEVQKAAARQKKTQGSEGSLTTPGDGAEAEAPEQAGCARKENSHNGAHLSKLPKKESGMLTAEQSDIVSPQDAQKATSIIEQVEYGLKRLVWG